MHRPVCEARVDIYRDRRAYNQRRYYEDVEKSRAIQRERKKLEHLRDPQKSRDRKKAIYRANPETIKSFMGEEKRC